MNRACDAPLTAIALRRGGGVRLTLVTCTCQPRPHRVTLILALSTLPTLFDELSVKFVAPPSSIFPPPAPQARSPVNGAPNPPVSPLPLITTRVDVAAIAYDTLTIRPAAIRPIRYLAITRFQVQTMEHRRPTNYTRPLSEKVLTVRQPLIHVGL